MNCSECENSLAAYAAGDLCGETSDACSDHLAECSSCREILGSYRCLITGMKEHPLVEPTWKESESMAKALRGVRLPTPVKPRCSLRQTIETAVLFITSILTFASVATVAWLLKTGRLEIRSFFTPENLVIAVVVVIFVASFIPITITAHRRPLNGATFKR